MVFLCKGGLFYSATTGGLLTLGKMSFADLLRFGDMRILKFSPINGLPAIGYTGTYEIGKAF